MKLYHISQDENNDYDTYSDLVVCAETEEEARNTHPCPLDDNDPWAKRLWNSSWCSSPDKVDVELIGEAIEGLERGIVCASFHAG